MNNIATINTVTSAALGSIAMIMLLHSLGDLILRSASLSSILLNLKAEWLAIL